MMYDEQPKAEYKPEDYIELYNGLPFHFMVPTPEMWDIESVAHSLSQQCRYAGHVSRFYSVAEHSVRLADWLEENHAEYDPIWTPKHYRTALMHDCAESVLVDVPRPIKNYLRDYKGIEMKIEMSAVQRYDLFYTGGWPSWVRDVDTRILIDERKQLMNPNSKNVWGVDSLKPLGITRTMGWQPDQAKAAFLQRFRGTYN